MVGLDAWVPAFPTPGEWGNALMLVTDLCEAQRSPKKSIWGNKQDKIFLQAFQGWFAAQHAVKALCLLVISAKTPLLKRAWRRAAVQLDTSVMAAPSRAFPCKMSVC